MTARNVLRDQEYPLVRLKHVCTDSGQYGLNVAADDYVDGGVRLIRTSDIQADGLTPDEDGIFITGPVEERFQLRRDDLVLSRAGTIGRAFLAPPEAEGMAFAGFLVRFRPRLGVVPRFVFYVTQGTEFQQAIQRDAVSNTISNFNAERYANLSIPLPPTTEQQLIADFLDRETAQIDAMIDAQRDLVIRLKERRTAMISSHVADDIGARRVQLRRVVRVSDGLVDPTKSPFTDMPLIAPNHIESGTGRLVEAVDSAADQSAISGKGHVRAGQLIYSKIRPALNKLAIAPSDCLCSADMYPLIVNQSMVVTRFLLYAMLDQAFVDQAVMVSERVAMPKVNRETLAGLVIPLPRIERQKDVVAHLDSSTAHIDSTIDAAQASITLMQERRSALISAAVTGRIDPRTGQESTPEMVLEPA